MSFDVRIMICNVYRIVALGALQRLAEHKHCGRITVYNSRFTVRITSTPCSIGGSSCMGGGALGEGVGEGVWVRVWVSGHMSVLYEPLIILALECSLLLCKKTKQKLWGDCKPCNLKRTAQNKLKSRVVDGFLYADCIQDIVSGNLGWHPSICLKYTVTALFNVPRGSTFR